MKAYPSLQELHRPLIQVGAAGCDFETTRSTTISGGDTTIASYISKRRKRIRRLTTSYLAATPFTGKRHAILASPSFPFCPPYHHLFIQKLMTIRRKNYSSFCSSNDDAEYLEEGGNTQPGFEPLINSDSISDLEIFPQSWKDEEDGIGIQIMKPGRRSRRIESRIQINASLSTIWDVLTDYEKLADFIPGLAVSRLLDKGDKYARLFQIGQQKLALGLKFDAKAVLDCYEKDLEILSFGQRRNIEFKMVEGDFETFEGKWSIEQYDAGSREASQAFDPLEGQEFYTILSYIVEVVPKLWLPVRLVEGRLCREIKTNLSCIRQEAQMRSPSCL